MQGNDQLDRPQTDGEMRHPPQADVNGAELPVMRKGKDAKVQPFGEHVRELRRRLLYSIATLIVGSIAGYALHGPLFRLIKRPLNEQLYYTTPMGGFNAIIKISILFGLIVTVPVFIYQLGKFLSPAFRRRIRATRIIFYSTVLAAMGVLFAYFVSLPAALHFLANVNSADLQSLITANEYINFVSAYVAGFALLFQLPLVLLFINRIKPQQPGRLMRVQRYVVLVSFIVAAILTPTPDPINQLTMALPIILLYQFSVGLIWLSNRRDKNIAVKPVLAAEVPAVYGAAVYNAPTPVPSPLPQVPTAAPVRKPQLIMDIFWVPQSPRQR